MSHPDASGRLVAVRIDEHTIGPGTREQAHERAVAIHDLLDDNSFTPTGRAGGTYVLALSLEQGRLAFSVRGEDGVPVVTHILSLTPLRRIIRDYFLICESYYSAIRTASPSQIETIDMTRRSLHDEASQLLAERLRGKIALDRVTARRLFTLISVLHWKG